MYLPFSHHRYRFIFEPKLGDMINLPNSSGYRKLTLELESGWLIEESHNSDAKIGHTY